LSGQAHASKQTEWYSISITDQRRMSIATTTGPDGSTSGPAEYFAKREANYLSWFENKEAGLLELLKRHIEKTGARLLNYQSTDNHSSAELKKYRLNISSVYGVNDVEIRIKVSNTLTADVRVSIIRDLKQLLA